MPAQLQELLARVRILAERPLVLAIAAPVVLLLAAGVVTLTPWKASDAPAKAAREATDAAFPSNDDFVLDTAAPSGPEEDWFAAQGPAPEAAAGDGYECLIEPAAEVEIGSPLTGLIAEVTVDRSDIVAEGEVLVRLESSVESAALEVAKARARMAGIVGSKSATAELEQKRLERAEQLYRGKALSLDVREEVETQAQVARQELVQAREEKQLSALELAQAEATVDRRTIRAPISGVVVDRMMNPGEVVDEEKILKIAQIHPLHVEALLPAALFGDVKPGMRAAVTPEQPGDQVHVARVVRIDRVIDPASGTFAVRMELPNAEYAIPSGLHCQVRFLGAGDSVQTPAAPADAPPAS